MIETVGMLLLSARIYCTLIDSDDMHANKLCEENEIKMS